MVPSTKTPVSIASASRGLRQSNTAAAYGAVPARAGDDPVGSGRANGAGEGLTAVRRSVAAEEQSDEASLEVGEVDELEADAHVPRVGPGEVRDPAVKADRVASGTVTQFELGVRERDRIGFEHEGLEARPGLGHVDQLAVAPRRRATEAVAALPVSGAMARSASSFLAHGVGPASASTDLSDFSAKALRRTPHGI